MYMTVYTDTHTHLYLPEFDSDRDETVARALNTGIKLMFVPNVDENSIGPMKELCSRFPENCFPMIGLHPESIDNDFERKLEIIENELVSYKYFGIGETGLDYYWDLTYKEQQKESFDRQLKLAAKTGLPVIIHVRNSREDVMDLVKKNMQAGLNGIFHCFGGSVADAEEITGMGFYIGIGGVVTFKNGRLDDVIRKIPLEYMVLETDAPYLAPVPYRGKRNEPAYIPLVAEKIAALKNTSIEEVAAHTTANVLKMFKIDSQNISM